MPGARLTALHQAIKKAEDSGIANRIPLTPQITSLSTPVEISLSFKILHNITTHAVHTYWSLRRVGHRNGIRDLHYIGTPNTQEICQKN